jgi:hypothetical protein
MSYKKILERLETLPPEERLLARFNYVFYEDDKPSCGCAVGKALKSVRDYKLLHRLKTKTADSGFGALVFSGLEDLWRPIAEEMNELEISFSEILRLQHENDWFCSSEHKGNGPDGEPDDDNSRIARRERYNYIIGWLKKHVGDFNDGSAATPKQAEVLRERSITP